MATPDPVKAQVILADQDRLQDTCRQFEAVSRGEKFINSEPLREVPSHSVKLKPLRAVHLSQVEGARDQRDRVFSLLQAYNNVVMMLSEQFVKWDRILASAEQRKGTAA
ncbi:hypothetical protein PTSG_13236 [Salpingoeca rosetta]|uniref:Uncharacterized protein n=1 Tax=Salpingoeca rosetta (strain ATCC 50818 / BSB-021) TaxID=946362 RepID=F2U056_SALR5|nr:uncharacterized protein PTSG_13236 [Salpingoeca rosetta]EGD80784.1 hypothetical protein PTSG_13236 [Salpingoeca rosetta]|eukprot:XP_004997345.1 hypothetical protein PTSG_13236 [Salpingoeca rosetta]